MLVESVSGRVLSIPSSVIAPMAAFEHPCLYRASVYDDFAVCAIEKQDLPKSRVDTHHGIAGRNEIRLNERCGLPVDPRYLGWQPGLGYSM